MRSGPLVAPAFKDPQNERRSCLPATADEEGREKPPLSLRAAIRVVRTGHRLDRGVLRLEVDVHCDARRRENRGRDLLSDDLPASTGAMETTMTAAVATMVRKL